MLWGENQCVINLSKDRVQNKYNKHIDIYLNFIKNIIYYQVIEVLFGPTKDKVEGIFTKSLIGEIF